MTYPRYVYRLGYSSYFRADINIYRDEQIAPEHEGLILYRGGEVVRGKLPPIWESAVRRGGIIIYYSGAVFDDSGKVTEELRKVLREVALEHSRQTRMNGCVVFSSNDSEYYDPEGKVTQCDSPPLGGGDLGVLGWQARVLRAQAALRDP